MIAEIIAAGSEMLTPHRQDTNSLFLTEQLNLLGVSVAFKTIVGDNLKHLTSAATIALGRADVVIFSGGLGPTQDDLTREAVSTALGKELTRNEGLVEQLRDRYAKRNMTLSENNLQQADLIEGAESLPNGFGSAPGQFLDVVFRADPESDKAHRKLVVLLPGPPREQRPMWAEQVAPRLRALLPPRHIATRVLRISIAPESQIDARISPIYKRYEDVETTILFQTWGEIQLHFTCTKKTQIAAEERVAELATLCEEELDDLVFSSEGESIEEVVLLMLGMRHLTLATAESCTGGLIAERLTNVPGASRAFLGGAVVYSDDLKTRFTLVPRKLIQKHGAVSPEVAVSLAEGIRTSAGADIGLGVTGIAGPGGATLNKPVGRVYIALASAEGTEIKELDLTGERERIRLFSSQHALDMLRKKLM